MHTEGLIDNCGGSIEMANEISRHSSPLGRMITVAEVAALCVYLASDDAAPILGTVVNIDGGYTAGTFGLGGKLETK